MDAFYHNHHLVFFFPFPWVVVIMRPPVSVPYTIGIVRAHFPSVIIVRPSFPNLCTIVILQPLFSIFCIMWPPLSIYSAVVIMRPPLLISSTMVTVWSSVTIYRITVFSVPCTIVIIRSSVSVRDVIPSFPLICWAVCLEPPLSILPTEAWSFRVTVLRVLYAVGVLWPLLSPPPPAASASVEVTEWLPVSTISVITIRRPPLSVPCVLIKRPSLSFLYVIVTRTMWPPFSIPIVVLWLILSTCCGVVYLWLTLSIPWEFVIMWPPLSVPCVLVVWSLSLLSILYIVVSICSALSVSFWFITYENGMSKASHRVSFIFFLNVLVPFLAKWRPSSWSIPFCASPL